MFDLHVHVCMVQYYQASKCEHGVVLDVVHKHVY